MGKWVLINEDAYKRLGRYYSEAVAPTRKLSHLRRPSLD